MKNHLYLTDINWLADNLEKEQVITVDCHWDTNAYLRAHIPGAIMRPGHPYIKSVDESGAISKYLPDPDQFTDLMNQMGISSTTTVICYDEWHNHFATRLWWLMRYYGHRDVKILNGGWQAWVEAKLPISTTSTKPRPSTVFQVDVQSSRLIQLEELLRNYQNPEWQIVDVRSDGEYDGSENPGNKRSGHIPGAIHLEWNQMLKSSDDLVHVLRDPDDMRKLLEESGIKRDRKTVVHCQSGVRATFMAYCLELLDYNNVRVYDGSMGEWANLEHTPLE